MEHAEIVQSNRMQYDVETVELALRVIVLNGGNCSRAARQLLNHGYDIGRRTLTHWKDETHATRYEQVLAEVRAELDKSVADTSMAIADESQEVTALMVRDLKEKFVDMEARDLARSVQALAQASATQVQTARLLKDQPTSINELRPPSEILADLKDAGIIEGTAQEVD